MTQPAMGTKEQEVQLVGCCHAGADMLSQTVFRWNMQDDVVHT